MGAGLVINRMHPTVTTCLPIAASGPNAWGQQYSDSRWLYRRPWKSKEAHPVAAYLFFKEGLLVCAFPLTPDVRPPTLNPMEVHLTPDQKAFVRQATESGRLNLKEEAVQEALSLWEQRERTRADIPAAVDLAEASVARVEGRAITPESMRQLADEVKQRVRKPPDR